MAIKAEISLDSSKAEAEARTAGKSISKGLFAGAESGITKLSSLKSALSGMVGAVKEVYSFAKKGVDMGKEFDDLKTGLEQALPAGANLADEMARIESMMSKPGVEWETAIKLQTQLLSLGFSATQAEDIITGVGNALKSTGSDTPENLTSAVELLTKMDEKGGPALKQLTRLKEISPALSKALSNAFPDANAKSLESMGLSSEQFLEGLTKGLKSLDKASLDSVDLLGKKADLAKLFASKQSSKGINMLPGEASAPGDKESAEKFKKEMTEKEKARKAALIDVIDNQEELNRAKSQEKDIQTRLDDARPSEKKALENQLEIKKEHVDKLELEIHKEKEMKTLMEEQNISEELALQILAKRVAKVREIADEEKRLEKAREDAKHKEELSARSKSNEIEDARAHGHKSKADRLQRAKDIEDKAKELEVLGMGTDEAKKQAEREVRTKDDNDYRDKTGRSRIGSSGRVRTFDGIQGGQSPRNEAEFPRLENMGRTQANRSYAPGATTKLTASEVAGSQSGNKAMEGLTAALKSLEAAAKKYTVSNLNP